MEFQWGTSCLAAVLANIILTEFEKQIIEDLIKSGTIKFYRRYVDDALVSIKPCDICTFRVTEIQQFRLKSNLCCRCFWE